MPAKPPFQVEGPPYPTDLPFYQTEALAFFTDKTELSLPFMTNARSIDLVKRLYATGATRVDAIVTDVDTPYPPTIREIEVFLSPTADSAGVQRVLESLCLKAKEEGRMIQLGPGDIPTSVNVWWEDI